jgi:hypothetical protein
MLWGMAFSSDTDCSSRLDMGDELIMSTCQTGFQARCALSRGLAGAWDAKPA